MKFTTMSFEFDGRNEQEVINVTKMLKALLSGASDEVSVETHAIAPEKEEKPVAVSKTTSTAVPTFSDPVLPAAPTPSEPVQPAAPTPSEPVQPAAPTPSEPVQPAAPTPSEPTKTAAPKKEAKPEPTKTAAPKKEAKPEPAKAEEETKSEAPTLKEMQTLVISSVRTGRVTRDEMASILLEFGGTSLSKVSPSKFALLKQRIENYPLTR